MIRKFALVLLIVVVVGVGYVMAQDDGDDGDGVPILPARTSVPATVTPLPTTTPIPASVASPTSTPLIPSATNTQTLMPLSTSTPRPTLPPGVTPTPTPEPLRVIVDVESAFIREKPDFAANPVSSAFRDDSLEVIGRNLDGTWFEVRRPYRPNSLGWISIGVIDYEFLPEFIPLTDLETGITGNTPLSAPVDFAVFISEGVALRTLPDRQLGERILNIPPSVVVPALARYQDGAWLKVNYLGNEGWIIGFTIRERDDILDLPQIVGLLPGENAAQLSAVIIPPEIQREQLERLRTYTNARLVVATDLANFWWLVQRGEVMPCNPPPTVVEYQYSGQDVQQLPEIDRYVPRLNEGVRYLNESVEVLSRCGVIDPRDVQGARNDAINSQIIIENTLVQLDNLEELIR